MRSYVSAGVESKLLLQSEQSIEAGYQQPRSGSPQGNEQKRQARKIAAKRGAGFKRCLRGTFQIVSNIDQGMSLLASKRGCIGWHRRLRCISIHPEGQSRWSKTSYRFSSHHHDPSIKKTRNIGIIAHIDAVILPDQRLYDVSELEAYVEAGQNNDYGAYALLQRFYSTDRRCVT
jgi:hypothetical protein